MESKDSAGYVAGGTIRESEFLTYFKTLAIYGFYLFYQLRVLSLSL